MTEEDKMIVKWKSLKMPNDKIARKLGIAEGEVQRRFDAIVKDAQISEANGYQELRQRFIMFAAQYELMGESLVEMSAIVSNVMTSEQLAVLITNNREETLKNLAAHAIVLHPYVPIVKLPKSGTTSTGLPTQEG